MSYRDVASKQVLIWACTAIGARMPVAMAPLALVFLVRERPGGYSLGAILAAAYVIGEIAGAPALMASSVAGLWLLPAGWGADDTGGDGRTGTSMLRLLTGAWPVYVTGAA